MELALLIFGAAFAAIVVWLSVRIVNRHERWAKWTLVATIALPVLYVASFGPTCWLYSRVPFDEDDWVTPDFIYAPVLRVWFYHDGIIPDAIDWYANVGSAIEIQAARETNADDADRSAFLVRVHYDD
jgi:hypothetical protein